MYVKKIDVIVTFDDGHTITYGVKDPKPRGDNPRFMIEQFLNGFQTIGAKMMQMIEARNPNQLVERLDQVMTAGPDEMFGRDR